MVRVKYRYLAIRIQPERKMVVSAEMCKKLISKALIEEFGYKSAIQLHNFQIIDNFQSHHIFNIKVLREIHNDITKSIDVFYKNTNSLNIETIAVSGSIRGLRKKVLQRCKKQTK